MENLNFATREKPPCKNCIERHSACWGGCEKYKAWKSRLDEINRNRREYEEDSFVRYNQYVY